MRHMPCGGKHHHKHTRQNFSRLRNASLLLCLMCLDRLLSSFCCFKHTVSMLRWMNTCIHAYGRKSNKQSKEWSKNVRLDWTLAELCVTFDLCQDQPQQRLPPVRETYGLNLLANPPDEDILVYHRSENFINSLNSCSCFYCDGFISSCCRIWKIHFKLHFKRLIKLSKFYA